jgi:hypothetical protein
MGRYVSGLLAAATTVGVVMLSVGVGQGAIRHWCAYRLATAPENTTAEALLLLY